MYFPTNDSFYASTITELDFDLNKDIQELIPNASFICCSLILLLVSGE